MEMDEKILSNSENFLFRDVHPQISIGTASDRYKGWIGQIYSEAYREKAKSRTNKVGKHSFRQEVLPIDCVSEYFQHFRALEIDYTFYAPLIENSLPTPCAKTLSEYHSYMAPGDQVFLKVPQMFFARKVRRGKEHILNDKYLLPEAFIYQFYQPAVSLLGDNLKGFIFEQEYQRTGDRMPPEELAASLDAFFNSVPRDDRYHVELRTEAYLSKPVFEVFRKHGVGQVLSHWTWLPSLKRQLSRAGGRFFHAGGHAVIRLMTPIGIRYEDAYARAFPFDKLIEDMVQPGMVPQTAELMWEGIKQGVEINVIINNRAGGNAPLIARRLVQKFIEFGTKRHA